MAVVSSPGAARGRPDDDEEALVAEVHGSCDERFAGVRDALADRKAPVVAVNVAEVVLAATFTEAGALNAEEARLESVTRALPAQELDLTRAVAQVPCDVPSRQAGPTSVGSTVHPDRTTGRAPDQTPGAVARSSGR